MTATPIADMVEQMMAGGIPAKAIVLAVRTVELSARVVGLSADSLRTTDDARRERDRLAKREKRANARLLKQQASPSAAAPRVEASADVSADKADNAPLSTSLLPFSQGNSKEEEQKEVVATPSEEPRARKRGTRLADDWQPTGADIAYAQKRGLSLLAIETEATKFRNYWVNRTDKLGTKPRWDLTWQNWILGVKEKTDGRRGNILPAMDRLNGKLAEFDRDDEPGLLAEVRGGAGAPPIRLLSSR